MNEKKLVVCAILAITIGIATIIPMQYLMTTQAQAEAEIAKAQEKANAFANIQESVQPMFSDLNITYANCNTVRTISNNSMVLYGATIEATVNFTLAQDALKDADAQIEYYKFAVSSDQGSIFNMGYYLVLEANSYVVTGMGGSEGTIVFANGLTFNGARATGSQGIDFGCGGQALNYGEFAMNYTWGYVSRTIFGPDPNNLPAVVNELRNAKNLFIDVTKICTVTVTGNVTITLPASDQILQHIELTKTDNEFVYGAYIPNTIPLPQWDTPSTDIVKR